jgi:cytochrome c peroxidase
MHDASKKTIDAVIDHYNNVPQIPSNTNLDPRLQGPGGNLNLTTQQKQALIAFLKTLSGNAVYTDPRWSDPFDQNGDLSISTGVSEVQGGSGLQFDLFPNPASERVIVSVEEGNYMLSVFDTKGSLIRSMEINAEHTFEIDFLNKGIYYVVLRDRETGQRSARRLVKE